MKKIFLSHPYSEEDTELIGKLKESFATAIVYDEQSELTKEEAVELNSDTRFQYRVPSAGVRKRIEAKIVNSDEVVIIITRRFKYY